MADQASVAPLAATDEAQPGSQHEGFWALALGSVGVVFGDIGTSPLYAMREALHHARAGIGPEVAVLGVVSLVTWALILIVTIRVRVQTTSETTPSTASCGSSAARVWRSASRMA